MKKFILPLLLFFSVGCAGTFSGNLEEARFELDQGNYSAAITAAIKAVNADPTDVEASRVLASAYFGRSGFDFLDLLSVLVDLDSDEVTNFQQVADALPESGVDLDDLRSAITTLAAVDGIDASSIDDEDLANAAFDLGMMMMLEHFVIGVYQSDFYGDFDVTGIDSDDRDNVQADLVAFDNRLIASGVESSESFLDQVRQTFCVLKPISAGEGFTLSEYRAFVGCQLSDEPDVFDTTAVDADIADCSELDVDEQPDDVQDCYDQNTSLAS